MSDLSNLSLEDLQAEMARRAADANAAASSAARSTLASGAVGDVGAPDIHPMDLARKAIADGLNIQHRSHADALALGVAQIMNAAVRGDVRANYTGRTAPGA